MEFNYACIGKGNTKFRFKVKSQLCLPCLQVSFMHTHSRIPIPGFNYGSDSHVIVRMWQNVSSSIREFNFRIQMSLDSSASIREFYFRIQKVRQLLQELSHHCSIRIHKSRMLQTGKWFTGFIRRVAGFLTWHRIRKFKFRFQ